MPAGIHIFLKILAVPLLMLTAVVFAVVNVTLHIASFCWLLITVLMGIGLVVFIIQADWNQVIVTAAILVLLFICISGGAVLVEMLRCAVRGLGGFLMNR